MSITVVAGLRMCWYEIVDWSKWLQQEKAGQGTVHLVSSLTRLLSCTLIMQIIRAVLNRKSHAGFQMAYKSMTLDDLEAS